MSSERNNRQKKKQLQRIKRKNCIQQRRLSPEAMRPEEFSNYLSSLGGEASKCTQELRDTNGSTETKDDAPTILWAVRDNSTGRRISATRPGGSDRDHLPLMQLPCQKTVTTAGFAEFRNVLARAWDFSPNPAADSASPRAKQPVILFLG